MTVKGRPRFSTLRERKFGGKVYYRAYHFVIKSQAQHYANKTRNLGISARVVGHARGRSRFILPDCHGPRARVSTAPALT